LQLPAPSPTLFPYTTLVRSSASDAEPIPPSDKRWYAAHDPTRSGVSGIAGSCRGAGATFTSGTSGAAAGGGVGRDAGAGRGAGADRKSTRLNSSHEWISYAV